MVVVSQKVFLSSELIRRNWPLSPKDFGEAEKRPFRPGGLANSPTVLPAQLLQRGERLASRFAGIVGRWGNRRRLYLVADHAIFD